MSPVSCLLSPVSCLPIPFFNLICYDRTVYRISLLRRKYIVLFIFALFVVSVPVTLVLIHNQQSNESHANPTSTLTLNPDSYTATVEKPFSLDVMLDP